MSPHEPKSGPPRLGLSLSQLVASALAAASAAFGASYLGVAGTIIGAAVASVIATVAGAMYSSSLQRTHHVVRSTVTQWSRTAAVAPVVDPSAPTPPHTDDTREMAPYRSGAVLPEPPRERRSLPWARLAVAAAAVLAVTLGALTGLEGLIGKPISSAVGGSDATGTTIGSVGGGTNHGKKKATTDTETSTPAATPTSEPTSEPTADPTTSPSAQPTPEPSDGATSMPTTPTTTGPSSDPTPDPTETPAAGG